MQDFSTTLLDAMYTISEHAIHSADFDRTIQAIILCCIDEAKGMYKVKYQDSILIAYSNNLDTQYKENISVYVLIPANDMSKKKTIIGTVSEIGEDYVNYTDLTNDFIENGINILNDNSNIESGLCSYKTAQKVLYDKNNSSSNILNINTTAATEYLKRSDYIVLKANFRVDLSQQQRRAGNYGIILYIDFYTDESKQNTVTKTYILDIDDMNGNPYVFSTATAQKAYYSIDKENFKEVTKISIFDENFIQKSGNYPDDIFVSNIEVIGCNRLTSEQKTGTAVFVTFPNGYIFTNTGSTTRTAQAQVRLSGKILSSTINSIKFYWFKEDSRINSGSPLYSTYGGKGWRCLNSVNQDTSTDDKFLPAGDSLTIQKTNVPVEKVRFKCVAVYQGQAVSSIFEILNTDSTYLMAIESEQQLAFFSQQSSIILKCKVTRRRYSSVPTLEYYWSEVTEEGTTSILTPLQDDNSSVEVFAIGVNTYRDYYCSVYVAGNGDFIGTASIRIFRKDENVSKYSLILNNGTQLFKYDENGNSPYNLSLEDEEQAAIPVLTFSVIDNQTGEQVDSKELDSIVWKFPLTNTLLIDCNQDQQQPQSPEEEQQQKPQYVEYENLLSCTYRIARRFSPNQSNNVITLKVIYHQTELTASTNFMFTKEGELGTNGTGIVCKIVATNSSGKRVKGWLINKILKSSDSNNSSSSFNWSNPLRVELWEDGHTIDSIANDSISWEILSNKDSSWYSINNSGTTNKGYVSLSSNLRASSFNYPSSGDYTIPAPANLIKVTVKYNDRQYYDVVPIVTVYSYQSSRNISIQPFGGFQNAVYSQDGENPKYDDSNPFTIVYNGDVSDLGSITWQVIGSVTSGLSSFKKDIHLQLDTSKNRQITEDNVIDPTKRFFKPQKIFDSSCVTNAILIKGNNFYIHIPVHLLLNRYGHKNLNSWDGNSIEIDNKGKYILSPQIGAGSKSGSNNTFTGMLMGTVADLYEGTTETGLLGYNEGERTLFLNAKNGQAIFGITGKGQIKISPGEQEAIIDGGSFQQTTQDGTGESIAGTGMRINLTEPSIKYGNGNFQIDDQGILKCKKGFIGPWGITVDALYYSQSNRSEINLGTASRNSEGYIYLGKQGFSLGNKFIFNMNQNSLQLDTKDLSIGGIPSDELYGQIDGNNLFVTSKMQTYQVITVEDWSKDHSTFLGCFSASSSSSPAEIFIKANNLNLQKDKVYTLSFSFTRKTTTAYPSGTSTNYLYNFCITKTNVDIQSCTVDEEDCLEELQNNNNKISLNNNTATHFVKITFKINLLNSNTKLGIGFNKNYTTPVLIQISKIMIESGFFASSWEVASQDLSADIQALGEGVFDLEQSVAGFADQMDSMHETILGEMDNKINGEKIDLEEKINEAKKTAESYMFFKSSDEDNLNSGLYISETAYTKTQNLAQRSGANIRITQTGIFLCHGPNDYMSLTNQGIKINKGIISLGGITSSTPEAVIGGNVSSGFFVESNGNLFLGKNDYSSFLQWSSGNLRVGGTIYCEEGYFGVGVRALNNSSVTPPQGSPIKVCYDGYPYGRYSQGGFFTQFQNFDPLDNNANSNFESGFSCGGTSLPCFYLVKQKYNSWYYTPEKIFTVDLDQTYIRKANIRGGIVKSTNLQVTKNINILCTQSSSNRITLAYDSDTISLTPGYLRGAYTNTHIYFHNDTTTYTTTSNNQTISYPFSMTLASINGIRIKSANGGYDRIHLDGVIDCHGHTIYNATVPTGSDKRLKKEIILSDFQALKAIKEIGIYSFRWKEEYNKNNIPKKDFYAGFIAQDFLSIEEKYKMKNYGTITSLDESTGMYVIENERIIPILWKGQQQLLIQLENLKKRVKELQKR